MRLAEINDEFGAARTNKKEFLEKMDRIIPWSIFISLIQPHYYKGERGNRPYELELMLRIFMLQNFYDLADMKVMNEILDSRAFSAFCCISSPEEVPDGDTIGRFRNLLIEHDLQKKIFDEVVRLLTERGLILKKGTIVDSTFIEVPSSIKNQKKERDPEAHSSKKGNTWHFGYKAHIGVDSESGLVHHAKTTAAKTMTEAVAGQFSRIQCTPDLLPSIDLPYMVVMTTYPGATPEEVEMTITRPLEQSLSTLEGIKSVSSQSSSNYALVILEFENGYNMDAATVNTLQSIDQIKGYWPELVGSPYLMKLNPNMLPVSVAAIDREGFTVQDLSTFYEEYVRNSLEGIDGVAPFLDTA